MSILVIAEHDNAALNSATLNVVTCAKNIGGEVHILIAGHNCYAVVSEAASVDGVSKVFCADKNVYENQLAENVSLLIADLSKNYTHILAPATTNGKNILPRTAALMDVAQISDVIAVYSEDTFQHPIYAGNLIETIQSSDLIKVLTVRTTAFEASSATGGSAEVYTLDQVMDAGLSRFVSQELAVRDRPELTSAEIVISGGRGMQNGDNFALLESIADKLGAAVGASRAAVDAGFVSNDMQVGQTGKIVAPKLYIAVGISGAIQHLAGMKDSGVIVAINKDPDAPIFQLADYGLVADLFEAIPELDQAL
jgi:electron transfer flavoprotein alpha subunit